MLSSGSALERLLARRPLSDIELGLDRVRELLERLEAPHRAFRSVHVGGTNGKGSTAAMIESVLRVQGRRTGLYTSPELLEPAERFRVDGEPLGEARLEGLARRLAPLVAETDATFFEAGTALAFEAFRETGVEIAVVEVGMGGRYDATNVVSPEVCVVTGVALDHTRWLGTTLPEVAFEKAGILKEGVPAALGPMAPEVSAVFQREAGSVGARLFRIGREARVDRVRVGPGRTSFRYASDDGRALRLEVPLAGEHQARNAALAVLALDRLEEPPGEEALRRGLRTVRWRGRGEWLETAGGRWLLDTAHNPEAAGALAALVRDLSPPEPVVLLASVLQDKDREGILDALAPVCEAAVLTLAPSTEPARRWDPETAAAGRGADCVAEPDFERALRRARELAGTGTVLVAGSTAVVGDALRRLSPAPGPRNESTNG